MQALVTVEQPPVPHAVAIRVSVSDVEARYL